jgi:hypothetical protein
MVFLLLIIISLQFITHLPNQLRFHLITHPFILHPRLHLLSHQISPLLLLNHPQFQAIPLLPNPPSISLSSTHHLHHFPIRFIIILHPNFTPNLQPGFDYRKCYPNPSLLPFSS